MKSRVGRPDRDAEDVGDPLERQVEVVVQDHHRAMVDGEPAEAALELVAIDDRAQVVVRDRARRLATAAGWVPSAVPSVPRRSRRAREAGTTRPRSGPDRGAAEGPARWRAAPAASRPRQDRDRAGSCAPRPGTDRQSGWQGPRRRLCRLAGLGPRDRYPYPFRQSTAVGSAVDHTVWAQPDTKLSILEAAKLRALRRIGRPGIHEREDAGERIPDRHTLVVFAVHVADRSLAVPMHDHEEVAFEPIRGVQVEGAPEVAPPGRGVRTRSELGRIPRLRGRSPPER